MYRSRKATALAIKTFVLVSLLASSGLAAQVGWPPSQCQAACHAAATDYFNTNPDGLGVNELRDEAGRQHDECREILCS